MATTTIPDEVRALMIPTPSGTRKLLAAWPGLSTETRIGILEECVSARHPGHLAARIYREALDDSVPYVRYLAARQLRHQDDAAVKDKIKRDNCDLVKYAEYERDFFVVFENEFKNPDTFFALPHEARLACVRSLRGAGEHMAALAEHAARVLVPEERMSEMELFELLADYVQNLGFREEHDPDAGLSLDGFSEYMAGKDVKALWKVIPKLPRYGALPLLEHLPVRAGLSSGIPQDALDQFDEWALDHLLSRNDVGLPELRRKIFFDDATYSKDLRSAAVWRLDLSDEEFAGLVVNPADVNSEDPEIKKKLSRLKLLSTMGNGLRPVVALALDDMISAMPWSSALGSLLENAVLVRDRYERAIMDCSKRGTSPEILRVRVYKLARECVPWDGSEGFGLPEQFQELEPHAVRGDPWATYMAFYEHLTWRHEKALEKRIVLDEIGEEYLDEDDEEDGRDLLAHQEEATRRIEDRVADVLLELRRTDDINGAVEDLSSLVGQMAAQSSRGVEDLKSEVSALNRKFEKATGPKPLATLVPWGVTALAVVGLLVSG